MIGRSESQRYFSPTCAPCFCFRFHIENFVTPIIDRCAHLHESYCTLRDAFSPAAAGLLTYGSQYARHSRLENRLSRRPRAPFDRLLCRSSVKDHRGYSPSSLRVSSKKFPIRSSAHAFG
jgi:hypothetical protein